MKLLILVGMAGLLAGCVSPKASPKADLLAVEAKQFAQRSESAIQQLLGYRPSGVIPEAKLKALSRKLDTQLASIIGKAVSGLFVLEATQVVELTDLEKPGSTPMKGLLVLAAPTGDRSFDWVAMVLVDMTTWDLLEVKLNTFFGSTSRTFAPNASRGFWIMNDYLQMLSSTKDSRYMAAYSVKRVFVPQNKETLHLDLDRLHAYLPNQLAEKRFIVNKAGEVYVSIKLTQSVQKVGDLR
jgi:hypothetical protein